MARTLLLFLSVLALAGCQSSGRVLVMQCAVVRSDSGVPVGVYEAGQVPPLDLADLAPGRSVRVGARYNQLVSVMQQPGVTPGTTLVVGEFDDRPVRFVAGGAGIEDLSFELDPAAFPDENPWQAKPDGSRAKTPEVLVAGAMPASVLVIVKEAK